MGQANGEPHDPPCAAVALATGVANPFGVHGVLPSARVLIFRPSKDSSTGPRVRVSIFTSPTDGSSSGAAGIVAVPSSSVPSTRQLTAIATECALAATESISAHVGKPDRLIAVVRQVGCGRQLDTGATGSLVGRVAAGGHQNAGNQRPAGPGGEPFRA